MAFFPSSLVGICMNSRNFLYNAPRRNSPSATGAPVLDIQSLYRRHPTSLPNRKQCKKVKRVRYLQTKSKQKFPRSNRRCFPNGVFQSVCSEAGQDPQRHKAPKMLENSGVFQAFFVPLKGVASVAGRGQESEKHRLETPFGTLWNSVGKMCVQ